MVCFVLVDEGIEGTQLDGLVAVIDLNLLGGLPHHDVHELVILSEVEVDDD